MKDEIKSLSEKMDEMQRDIRKYQDLESIKIEGNEKLHQLQAESVSLEQKTKAFGEAFKTVLLIAWPVSVAVRCASSTIPSPIMSVAKATPIVLQIKKKPTSAITIKSAAVETVLRKNARTPWPKLRPCLKNEVRDEY